MAFTRSFDGFENQTRFGALGQGVTPFIGPVAQLIGAGIKVSAGGDVTSLVGPGLGVTIGAIGLLTGAFTFGIGALVGSVVGSIIGSLFGGGDAEKSARDAAGRKAIQKLNQEVLDQGSSGYLKYKVPYLERMWQLARPDEMKPVFTNLNKKGYVVTDKMWTKIWPYIPVIEATVVLKTINYFMGHTTETTYDAPRENMMENIRSYLSTKGIEYPTSDEIALNIIAEKPTVALTHFLAQLQKQYEIQKQRALIDLEIDTKLQSYGLIKETSSVVLQPVYDMINTAYYDKLGRAPTLSERNSWAYNLISGIDESTMLAQLQSVVESSDPNVKTTIETPIQDAGIQIAGMSTPTMLIIAGIGAMLLFSGKK